MEQIPLRGENTKQKGEQEDTKAKKAEPEPEQRKRRSHPLKGIRRTCCRIYDTQNYARRVYDAIYRYSAWRGLPNTESEHFIVGRQIRRRYETLSETFKEPEAEALANPRFPLCVVAA